MSWEKVKLGDVCKIGDGAHASLKRLSHGIPYLTAKNLTRNGIDVQNLDFIDETTYNKHFKESSTALTRPQKNDILYSIIGSIGGVYLVKDEKIGISSSVAIFRSNPSILISKYLYYYLKSSLFDSQIQAIKGGVAQGFMSLSKLSSIEISYPLEIKTQKRIADILSAYDDLIENNQKQIKLLEEAAQRLYKHWFIDLRFPGHETTPIVDGIPQGWRKDRADSFFNITIGKTPPRAEKQWFTEDGNGMPWISISDMGTDSAFLFETSEGLTLEAIKRHNVKVVPANTVLLSFKLTVGRVSITTTEMCTNEAIAHFVADDDSMREYAYCYLKNFHYDELGSTSSISKAINSKIVKAMPFVMPSDDIVKAFHKVMKPMFDQIFTKQKQIKNLSQSRDRLLPKLMNGELEVS